LRGVARPGVNVFRGVPYAEPPVGKLRWQDPVAKAAWTGVREAYADGAGCPQNCTLPGPVCPTKLDEDCLYLNVFAPTSGGAPKAVLFFIHGGDFYQGFGGGVLYDGQSYSKYHDVVLVSINYRLGALGFLYSGNDPSTQFTGNFGLHDQQLAMRCTEITIYTVAVISATFTEDDGECFSQVDAGQHRPVQRRPLEGDHLRRERGRHVSLVPPRDEGKLEPVPRRDHREQPDGSRAGAWTSENSAGRRSSFGEGN
jgi:hypothetical protein